MHQVSLDTICPLKAFQFHYCPDNDAKSILKHFIFLHKFSVLTRHITWNKAGYTANQLARGWAGAVIKKAN